MIAVKIKDKYKNLSRDELLDKAYELGFGFEKYSTSCCQSVVAAMHEMLEIEDSMVRASNSSAGGQVATTVGTCGGLIGGTMVLDYFFGRTPEEMVYTDEKEPMTETLFEAFEVAKQLYDRYFKEYGTIICPQIQVQLYGRHYYLLDEDEVEKFEAIGAHSDPNKSCCRIVGNAARWTLEILLNKTGIL